MQEIHLYENKQPLGLFDMVFGAEFLVSPKIVSVFQNRKIVKSALILPPFSSSLLSTIICMSASALKMVCSFISAFLLSGHKLRMFVHAMLNWLSFFLLLALKGFIFAFLVSL